MRKLVQRIKSAFKAARVSAVDDTIDLRGGTLGYQGLAQEGTLWTPYGLCHNPPVGSLAIVWAQNGQDSNAIGIADAPAIRTLRNLKSGEVGLANYLTGSYALFKENGDLDVTAVNANVNIVANNVNITLTGAATFTIGGTTITLSESGISVAGGDVTADGVSLKTHTHSGVQPGSGNTGGPN